MTTLTARLSLLAVALVGLIGAPGALALQSANVPLVRAACSGHLSFHPVHQYMAEHATGQPSGGSACMWKSAPLPADGTRYVSVTYRFAQSATTGARSIQMIDSRAPDVIPEMMDTVQDTPVTLTGAWDQSVMLRISQSWTHNYGGATIMNVGHNLVPYATAVDATPPWVGRINVACPRVEGWCTATPKVTFPTRDNAWGRGLTQLLANGAPVRTWGAADSDHRHDLDVPDGVHHLDAVRYGTGWAPARHDARWRGGVIERGQDQPLGVAQDIEVSVDRNAPAASGLSADADRRDVSLWWEQTDGAGSGIARVRVLVQRAGEWALSEDAYIHTGEVGHRLWLDEATWPAGTYRWALELTDNVGHVRVVPADTPIVIGSGASDTGDAPAERIGDAPADRTPTPALGPRLTTLALVKKAVPARSALRVRVGAKARAKVVFQVRRAGRAKVVAKRVVVVRAGRVVRVAVPTGKLRPGRYVLSVRAKGAASGRLGSARGVAFVIRARR